MQVLVLLFLTAILILHQAQNALRIHSSGDFTVGNTGAVGTWYNGGSTGFGFSSGAYCGIVRSGTNTPLYVSTTGTGAGGFVEFNQATTVRGNITFNGSSTLYNATSDYRLKENVVDSKRFRTELVNLILYSLIG